MRNTRSSRSVIPFCVPLCCLFLIGFVTSAKARKEVPPVNVCGPSNPVANPEIMGGVMCQQAYALCIAAPCVEKDDPQPTGKEGDTFTIGGGFATEDDITGQVECSCLTIIGNNIGKAACDTAAPEGRAQNGDQIISTYSFQQNNKRFRVLTCNPEDFSRPLFYADCYNQPCTIDEDSETATCTCPVFLALRAFITRGGECQQDACTDIFSAAPADIFPDTNNAMACGIGNPTPPQEFACKRGRR